MQTDTLTQEQFLEALRLLAQPTWADQAGVVVGFLQVGLIAWGLWQMSQSGERRDRALDQQAETLGKIGQALDRQGEALRQQGEALRQQGRALETLIERTAPR